MVVDQVYLEKLELLLFLCLFLSSLKSFYNVDCKNYKDLGD